MQTVEIIVIRTIERLTKHKVTCISKGDTTYTREDLELAEKWRKFLSGDNEQPKLKQLSLF